MQITHTQRHQEKITGRNPTRRKDNPGVIIFSISANKTGLAQQGNANSSTELLSPPYWIYLHPFGRTFGETPL